MQEINEKSIQKGCIVQRLKLNWAFWVIILSFIVWTVFEYSRYSYKDQISFFLSFTFLPLLFLAFLCSIMYSLFLLLAQGINFFKKMKIDTFPFLLFCIQICFALMMVSFAYLGPNPDYFKANEKSLNSLVLFVKEQIKGNEFNESGIKIKVPRKFGDLAYRSIYAETKNGVSKINVNLTGSAFGGHSFLLYKSDGNIPLIDNDEIPVIPEHKPIIERKNKNWFFVDLND